ncbi:HvfC family RiPP maturation protein [Pseudomonas fluorescens]|uniref:HvfC family RiPP maturation protein n=1 Tax=Pseudomonas fluorescens TaxID=294 RepID=UPI001A9DAC6B|nr:putative DNA-binding domain-containing protein [Pseudomonas fluorescens]QTD31486.1 putative DNA-binding domain-containing protein [Pseudomonas fluorescens]
MKAQPLQAQFAARIRSPETATLPEWIHPRRMAIYEELFFNNLESFLRSGFPVLQSLLDPPRWQRLVRAFMRDHCCKTPYFGQLGQEFIAWLDTGYTRERTDPAFLAELAHYEWIELALTQMQAPAIESLPASTLLWSPLALPLAYEWPVHQVSPTYQPTSPLEHPSCLLVWRDRNDRVRFMQLSAFSYHLACRLQQAGTTGPVTHLTPLLTELVERSGLSADPSCFDNIHTLLNHWLRQDILLGTLPLE